MNISDKANKPADKKKTQSKISKGSGIRSVKKDKKGRLRWLWISAPVITIAAIILIVAAPYIFTSSAKAAIIRIPPKATENNLRDTLQRYFDPEYALHTFEAFRKLGRTPAERFGAYEIPEGSSPLQAARILSRGKQTEITLTINGVRELDSFLPRIAGKFSFPVDSLRAILADSAFMQRFGLTPEQAPALFLNDSYRFFWTASPKDIVEKIGANYNRFWNETNRRKAADLGLSPAEICIIASITDEETQAQSEKGRIGRLYINRLHKGMRLQADPTVKFALKDFSIKRVTKAHLSAPGPYNTYQVAGLPPGPIRTTSTATLREILDSKPSDDLYMCAKEDFSGTHNFASTFEEHKENARRYQQALDERGIK
ncbi:MAG: endolytic transglycosylase MltG [Muribaculaceae bacterium]|nr:endolytic transglycosylase MltG [Muribaculaceae bacterium]